jgi:hypothetical protein
MAAVVTVGFGGALQALWNATGSALGAAAVLGEALGHGAEALNNVAKVAEETSAIYLDETRASRKSKQLLLARDLANVEAGGQPSITA